MIKQSLDNVSRLLSVTNLLPVEQHRWLLATSVLGMTCSHRLVPYYLSYVRYLALSRLPYQIASEEK